jgi:hypothetical protein
MIENVNSISDRQKMIHIYLKILNISNNNLFSNVEIVSLLKSKFDYDVLEKDVQLYFEPTVFEDEIDLRLQMKHLM